MGQFKEFIKEAKKPKGFKLKYKFKHVDGDFNCSRNKLISLEGVPKKVGGDFFCGHNLLVSLEDAPREIDGGFYCFNNPGPSGKGFTEKYVKQNCKVGGEIAAWR